MSTNVTTLQQLIDVLQGAMYQQDGVWYIDLDADLLPEAGELVGYLDKSELTIANAVLTPHVSDVTITGTAPLLDNDVQYNVTLVGTVVDRVVRFVMPATPVSPSTWTFTGTFSAEFPEYITQIGYALGTAPSFFYGIAFSGSSFVDATFNDASLGVVRGLTFSTTWNATAPPFNGFTADIPGAQSMALAGSVVPRTSTFPLLDLKAPAGITYDLDPATLTAMYIRLATADHAPIVSPGEGASLVLLGGTVNAGGSPFDAEAPMLQGDFVWSFQSLPGQRVPLAGLDSLHGFVGDNPLILPPALISVSQWDLTEITFGVDPNGSAVQFLGATVSTREPWNTPVPKVVIQDLHARWIFNLTVPGPAGYQIAVGGTLAVGDPPVILFAEADFPTFQIEAGLAPDETISVTNAIRYLTGVTIPLDLLVTRLLFSVYAEELSYTFEAEVTGTFDYPVAGITYGLINLTIYYTPNSLAAVLIIVVTVGGQNFSVEARTPVDDRGWIFTGGLLPGSTFSLAEFVQELFGWTVPASVAGIEVEALWLTFATGNGNYSFNTRVVWRYQIVDYPFEFLAELSIRRIDYVYSGFVRGSFRILDLAIAAAYYFQPSSSTIVFEIGYKGYTLQASLLSVTDKKGKTTRTLQVRFPDVSLGDILTWLVSLADPDLDFALPAPWSILNQISLKNLLLKVDLDTNAVTLLYLIDVNLGFMSLDAVGMTYDSRGGEPGVRLELSGKFLGQEYSAAKGNPLEWDVVNEPAPEVPAKGPKLFDIDYLGFGQRVAFADTTQLNTVTDVINALKAQLTPPRNYDSNPLALANGSKMRFDRASHVLVGASFSILETVSLGVVFNDPYLYGIALSLGGPRAGSMSGLHFELLYKKVSENTGVFKVVLTVPDAFRQWDFGSVSITLPVIKLDIYTNGNFRVDLGFPHGGDFTDSFTVQVFPFIGSGGFYFASLTGETSERVPRIVNGVFNPVIEAGLGLRVGLGKEIEKGPLSGGISITVQGIVEGVVGWFTPYDDAVSDAKYYWIQGTIAIVGRVYGKIDFVVIKVSVSVEARLSTTLTVESYEPMLIKVEVRVEAKATVTILFVDINFSFELELEEEFVIGTRSTPPWVLAAGGGSGAAGRQSLDPMRTTQPSLRMQRSQYRICAVRPALLPQLFSTAESASLAQARIEGTTPAHASPAWPAVLVFDAIQNVPVMLFPALTVATPPESPSVVRSEIVLALFVENSVAPGAIEHDDIRRATAEHSARADDPDSMPFNLLVQAMLRWAIYVVRGSLDGNVTYGDLALAYAELQDRTITDDTFSYANLSDFLAANFVFQVSGIPTNVEAASPVSGTVFPMFPAMEYSAPGVPTIDFSQYDIVTPEYELNTQAYYEQLDVDFLVDRAVEPFGPRPAPPSPPSGANESMAMMIFREYFLIIARSAVQAGLDVLGKFQYTLQPNDSLDTIAANFPPVPSTYTARAGDTPQLVAEMYEMTLAELEALNPGLPLDQPLIPSQVVNVRIAVTPQTIASANQQLALATPLTLALTDVLYQIAEGDTLDSIARRFDQSDIEGVVATANAINRQLLRRGAALTVAQTSASYQWFAYTSQPGDDLALIAAWAYGRSEGAVAGFVSPNVPPALSPNASPQIDTPADPYSWYVQAILDFNDIAASPGEDLSHVIPGGTPLLIPGALYDSDLANAIAYTSRTGDTIPLIAAYFEAIQNSPAKLYGLENALESLNPGMPWNDLPPGTTVKMPPVGRIIQGNDTFLSIAALFGVAVTDLAGANATSTAVLAPLAVFSIPLVEHPTAAGDTIAKVAAEYNLTIAELANDVAPVPGLFAYPPLVPLTIPGVPSYGIDDLCSAVVEQQSNNAATMVSRFLFDGLRLPNPDDGVFLALDADALRSQEQTPVQLEALYVLTGQQLPLPDSSELPYDITFTINGGLSWIEFTGSTVVLAGDPEPLRAQHPGIEALNPAVDFSRPIAPGTLLLTEADSSTQMTLTITEAFVAANEASTTFDPEILFGPRSLPLFGVNPAQFELPRTVHWQTPATPDYADNSAGSAPAAGEPTLWPFSAQLLQRVTAVGSPASTWSLYTKSGRDAGKEHVAPVALYDWAALIPIRVSQIVSSVSGSPLPNSYAFAGAAQESRDALRELFTILGDSTAATISILWSPNVDSNNSSGLASNVLDPNATFVLKTNLTTLTASGNTALAREAGPQVEGDFYSAPLAQPGRFLELLWEGSVTNSGGYTLQYATIDGAGLPDALFASGNETELDLLVVLDSQSAPSNADRHIYSFNNCALVGDNIDPSTQSVLVESDDPAAGSIKTASVPPGNVGFELARQNPAYGAPSPLTPSDRTESLFSLLGFRITGGSGFVSSNEGLPVSPGEAPASAAIPGWSPNTMWYYRQVFPASALAASTLPAVPGLPSPAGDPYAGVAPDAALSVAFAFSDVYGNDVDPSTPIDDLAIDVGYTDDLVGLAQWPAIDASYAIDTPSNPTLTIGIALRTSTYVPGEGNGYMNALLAASAGVVRVERAYDQLLQDDVAVSIATSLNPQPYAAGALGKATLGNFLGGAYLFLNAVQKQLQTTIPAGGETFLSLATALASSGSPSDQELIDANVLAFGSANAKVPASSVFASIRMPVFHTTAAGDTLSGIARLGSPSLTVTELAEQNAELPLNGGVTIGAPLRQSPPTPSHASFASVAASMQCSVGTLATLNASRTSILTLGKVLVYSERAVEVTYVTGGSPIGGSPDFDTISLDEVCARFRNEGVAPTPADVAVANKDLAAIFWPGTVLDAADYVVQAGDTFDSLQAIFSIDALATAAQASPNIFPSGLPLFLWENPPLVPQPGDTLESIALTQGMGLDQLTVFNEQTPIVAPAVLLPSRVTIDPSATAYVPYSVPGNTLMSSMAAAFGETPDALVSRNWEQPFVFNPQQTVAAGGSSAVTQTADSMARLYARMIPPNPPMADYVAALAQQQGLFRSGAMLVEPLPSTGTSPATPAAVALNVNAAPAFIAQANAALDGFLLEGATVVFAGEAVRIGAHETFDSLVARYKLLYGIETTVGELAEANANVTCLAASQRFLLAPPPVVLEVALALPSTPAYPGNPFRLVTELLIDRDRACIDPDFADAPAVRESRSLISPYVQAVPGGGPDLSLQPFAAALEAAIPTLKLAVGGAESENTGPSDIWCVDFGPAGIASVTISGGSPSYFAIRPLSTTLRDKSAVPIAPFDPATGTLGTPEPVDFQAVDLDVWASTFAAAVDLILTAEYAVPAYVQNAAAFDSLVSAKASVAQSMSDGLENLLGFPSPAGVVADARERLRQALLVSLSAGFATDAVIQYPVQVESGFTSPTYDVTNAPRISGQPTALVWNTGAEDTIGTIAGAYGVTESWIARLLADVVRILAAGTAVTWSGNPYTLQADETIRTLYVRVGATSWDDFVTNLSAPNGFFVPYTTINIFAAGAALAAMTTGPAITFDTMVEFFGAPLAVIVANDEERPGIFIEGVTITVSTGSVVVTAENDTLVQIASAVSLTPLELAEQLETTPDILSPQFVAVVVDFVPEYTLSAAKTSMWNGASTMNVLFNVKSEARRRNLFLDLDYRMNEFEYDVRTLAGTGGYQASEWLSFVIPIGAGGGSQPISSDLGLADVPIPLRAYPALPALLSQSGAPAYSGSPVDLETAKLWNYGFAYQYDDAAQDALYVQAGFNIAPDPSVRMAIESPSEVFFDQLAQFVAVYDAMAATLAGLLTSSAPDPVLSQTLTTFAELVTNVADAWVWGPAIPRTDIAAMEDERFARATLLYDYELTTLRTVTLNGVVLTLLSNGSPSPTGVFPDLYWKRPIENDWHPAERGTPSENQIVYTFDPPIAFDESVQFQLVFPDLDVLLIENAIAGAHLTRNEALVTTAPTRPDFIYRTGEVAFPTLYQPLLQHGEPISFNDGTDLQDSLQTMFDTLLGPNATAYTIDVAVQFGYSLTGAALTDPAAIVSNLPVAFLPAVPYDSGLPARLAAAIWAWQSSRPLPPGPYLYIIAVTVYSTLQPSTPQLQLTELYYEGSASP